MRGPDAGSRSSRHRGPLLMNVATDCDPAGGRVQRRAAAQRCAQESHVSKALGNTKSAVLRAGMPMDPQGCLLTP